MDEKRVERPDVGEWRGFPRSAAVLSVTQEGLRERKKRLTRKMISDTATLMFIQRGFDNVKITEVAAACGVSEKTVYNYFATKESLVLDIEDEITENFERSLGPDAEHRSPVAATLALITEQVRQLVAHVRSNNEFDMDTIRVFMDMIESTPSLRAAQFDMTERLAQVAARAMAQRAGVNPEDPEPQIAADALLGLWRLYFRAIVKYGDEGTSPEEFEKQVLDDIERAARLIATGLWSFAMSVQGTDSRDELRVAAQASNEASKQVARALKEAQRAWLRRKSESTHDEARGTAALHRASARSRAQEMRKQSQQLKRDVHNAKQELRNEIREQVRATRRATKKK